jgi:hypothetical protein
MILLRRNSFSETSVEISYIENETALDLVKRTIKTNGYDESEQILDHFQLLINGLKVEKELWPIITIKESDQVLIAPELKRGEGAQIFKQIAIVAITVVASYFLGPTAGMTAGQAIGAAAVVAAVSIGSTLLLNSLIPPPELPGLDGLGGLDSKESQMYAITGQSNQIKKFGIVPKVYGTHKMFPAIAANPYTELRSDPNNDSGLIQYFVGVYDFGIGPLDVRNLKIGDTLISNFTEVEYALVDFKNPTTNQTVYDEIYEEKLQFYKGDVEREDVLYALNENRYIEYPSVLNADESEYRAIRNVPINNTSGTEDIVLDFIFPQGLIAYDSSGKTYDRTVELVIEFSKATGPEVWRGFNDLAYVKTFKTLGGTKNVFRDVKVNLPNRESYNTTAFYDFLYQNEYDNSSFNPFGEATYNSTQRRYYRTYKYGLKKGRTQFRLKGSVFTTMELK